MGGRSNWSWNRTVKELQEPEIGTLRNAQQLVIASGANLPRLFLLPGKWQKGNLAGKAGKSPTSGDQVALLAAL